MGLKRKLFGPAWQSRNAETRANAVMHMQERALIVALPTIALNDTEANIRKAAIQRINDIIALDQCRQQDSDADNRQLATQRLVHFLCQLDNSHSLKPLQKTIVDLLDNSSLPGTLIEDIAQQAQHSELRGLALQRISKPGLLGDRVLKEQDPALQALALDRIEQISTLERIAKSLRKTNKKLYHQVQAKLAALAPDLQGVNLGNEQALQCCQQLDDLLKGKQSADNQPLTEQLQVIDQLWAKITDIDGTLQQRFDNTRAILQKTLAGPQPIISEPVITEVKAEPVPAPTLEVDQNTLNPQLEKLAAELPKILHPKTKQTSIDRWHSTWRNTWDQLDSPTDAEQRLHESVTHQLSQHTQQQNENQAEQEAQQAALDKKVSLIVQAAEDGQLSQATEQLQALRDTLPSKPDKKTSNSLYAIDQQLGELRRWQRWSDNEQRMRLIKSIEKALEDELNPDALITLVRDSRSTWKQLEAQETAHGMRPLADDHSLARQFKGVCGRAMGHTKQFVGNRNKVQHDRQQLLTQLLDNTQQLLAQPQIDARELIKHKRILGKSFHELSGLPPKSRKHTAETIRSLLDQISTRLTDVFSEAETSKRKLIRQAEQLQYIEEREDAIAQAKQLQRQWQQTGPTTRKLDQELWQAFRIPLDPLFEQQQQQREAQQTEITEQHTFQETLCTQLEALVAIELSEFAANAGKAEGLQAQWPEEGNINKALLHRFQKATDQFKQRLEQWHNQQRAERQQVLAGAAQLRQTAFAKHLSQGIEALNNEEREVLSDLIELTPEQLAEHLQNNGHQAHQLCITAEFLAGLPSPEEDRNARMQYQIERLAERMSQRDVQQDLAQEVLQLERQWYQHQPLTDDTYGQLNSRFHKALAAAQQLAGT